MIHKLKSRRGETLVEAMASIVIAALSVALLFTCVMAASQINRMAREADEAYYAALTAAETQMADADHPVKSGKIEINGREFNISLYGGEGMYAYAKGGTGP